MSIYYALISRESTVLVDYTEHSGNFQQITMAILQNIDTKKDTMCSYSSGEFIFHVVVSSGLVYLCMADESMGKSLPYAYLHKIKTQFESSTLFERAMHCNAYELKRDFTPVLGQHLRKFNKGDVDDASTSKIRNLQRDVDEVKTVMTQNIGKILDRGDKLDILVDKTEDLSKSSESFAKSSRRLKNKAWWENKKLCVITVAVILAIIGIITIIILVEENVI